MLSPFRRLFKLNPEPVICQHINAVENRYLADDDTPMLDWHCPDCGKRDSGHVYADPANWVSDGWVLSKETENADTNS